ncbi:YjjG family noncanonical pyrimidine nucleotidase [Mangrovibacterium lignilyticum]|uniref:YjjG family noncanonical pyrimidine nucleotidase n=1 Tax=Mangrovibacterium lignilyticum TaxID=2668052 RepID=UPI0013D0B44F|nr:YjjG family noncanonical pyrimidine nucleotidase [Mangrovibacterium lignilyticum]
MSFTPKYTHLFFDLDNTIWDFDRNAKLAMRETVNLLKLDQQIASFDTFYDSYETLNNKLWDGYRKQEIQKKELITKRFADTLAAFEINEVDPIAMNDLYLECMSEQTALIEGALDVLKTLKQRNFHLQIITNGFRKVQLNKLKNCGISHFFDHVFISEDISYPKPDEHIFKHAIRSSNAKKSKCIMIGDNWETDILGARNYGIDQIFLTKSSKINPTPTQKQPTNSSSSIFSPQTPYTNTFCIEKLTNILLIV